MSTIALQYGGLVRTCELLTPDGYSRAKRWPLLISLHGGGSNAIDHLAMTGLAAACAAGGVILAVPNGTGSAANILTWNAGTCCGYAVQNQIDDVGFLGQLLTKLVQDYSVDMARVTLNGFSNGAMMAYRIAAQLGGMYGVCGVGATIPRGFAPIGKVRVLHVHGRQDKASPWNGGLGVSREFDAVGVGDHMHQWCAANGANYLAGDIRPIPGVPESDAIEIVYPGGIETRLIRLPTGGHTWPGGSMPLNPATRKPYSEIEVGKLVTTWSASQAVAEWCG